jgi:hypothetical protein
VRRCARAATPRRGSARPSPTTATSSAAEIVEHAIIEHLSEAIDALVRLRSHAEEVANGEAGA